MNREFNHAVDKKTIPTINILGVDVSAINMEWLLAFTVENIYRLSGDYICVSNVHTTVMSYEEADYRSIQNGGIMAIPDGGPLSTVGRKRGAREMSRTTGPDYLGAILEMSCEYGWKHYFYGATQETLDKLKVKFQKEYPGVLIAGMYSPPFRKLTEKENEAVINDINEANPDFIWVGLGAPKQEEWMAAHQGKVKGLMVGVGAAFDYFAGNIQRAPEWMQRSNLEWLYRFFQDPQRLFKRYLVSNTKFIIYVILGR